MSATTAFYGWPITKNNPLGNCINPITNWTYTSITTPINQWTTTATTTGGYMSQYEQVFSLIPWEQVPEDVRVELVTQRLEGKLVFGLMVRMQIDGEERDAMVYSTTPAGLAVYYMRENPNYIPSESWTLYGNNTWIDNDNISWSYTNTF